tara:strand:- start:2498 stop:3094 length:597 start_codon:yes stop_codon:yes gene_type:complete
MNINKKGAMFGLDARIALAIFGALSVISGAALYSAIQEAKVTAIITEMNELGKAVDAFELDTGVLPAFDSVATNHMDAMQLVSSSVDGWNGPYYAGEQNSSTHPQTLNFKYPSYDYIGVRRMSNASWGNNSLNNCVTAAANPCSLYIISTFIPKNIADKIDEKIDGTVDASNGKVRVYSDDGVTNWSVWMQYRPYTYK